MASLWSQWMLIGPLRVRLATAMTIGALMEDVTYSISHMKASPADAVAVATRAPAADEPTHMLRALCSDSAHTYSVSTVPSATKSEYASTMMVWGVMG
ncbi:MAG: hypothetical protein A4E30_01196 [Methanomassiliicoccales archaeon PtaB.Bin215]|nr:MAG: hypothetical protein A4E30_01196 [Methanomassiliicoccales archaeon PtaB.Bin215]